MKLRAAIVLAFLTGTSSPFVSAQCLDAGIETAFRHQDVPELQRDLAARINKPAINATDAELLGLSAYRTATILSRSGRNDEIKDLLKRAVEKIEPVWNKNKGGDLSAVLSMLYGFQIGMSPWFSIRLGQKAQEMLESAENVAPISPRLHLAEALSRYYRPQLLGGGPSNAALEFNLSIAGYGPGKRTEGVCWGRTDAMLGLARAKIKLNERAAAIALIDEVLVSDPMHPVALWLMDDLRNGKNK